MGDIAITWCISTLQFSAPLHSIESILLLVLWITLLGVAVSTVSGLSGRRSTESSNSSQWANSFWRHAKLVQVKYSLRRSSMWKPGRCTNGLPLTNAWSTKQPGQQSEFIEQLCCLNYIQGQLYLQNSGYFDSNTSLKRVIVLHVTKFLSSSP